MLTANQIPNASIASVQVGKSKDYITDDGKRWTSAIHKLPVDGPVRILKTSVEGDQQSDLVNHGGIDKAVLAYSSDHFSDWIDEIPTFAEASELNGAFGENLTIAGLQEQHLCIGDILKIGTATFQISQPRQPCWKLSRLWNIPLLEVAVQKSGRTGWYLRVIQTGAVNAGDEVSLIERPHPECTVAQANRVMYAKPRIAEEDLKLANCPALSEAWKSQLRDRASRRAR